MFRSWTRRRPLTSDWWTLSNAIMCCYKRSYIVVFITCEKLFGLSKQRVCFTLSSSRFQLCCSYKYDSYFDRSSPVPSSWILFIDFADRRIQCAAKVRYFEKQYCFFVSIKCFATFVITELTAANWIDCCVFRSENYSYSSRRWNGKVKWDSLLRITFWLPRKHQ